MDLRQLFLLDPAVTYLNHGSFGACPRPVFQTYQEWQLELERQPVDFLDRRAPGLMAEARAALAEYVGCGADDLVYFPNPTTAINMVARSLKLGVGDEILTTDHEYGAVDRTWRFICSRRGARYIRRAVPLPIPEDEAFIEHFWSGVNEHTRAIFISHITSPTAIQFPVEEICVRAREAGLLTIVDGAHAPGQIPLDLADLGADIYAGACHKWLCAPKGASFLYARPEVRDILEPLVVSWGWEAEQPGISRFIDYHEWQGTRDIASFLSVPAAIEFQRKYRWDDVRRHCIELAAETRDRLLEIFGTTRLTESQTWALQMAAVELPEPERDIQRRLLEEHRIEIAVQKWSGRSYMRFSFQGYNNRADANALINAVQTLYARS
ncbi:MAG: aminotransferase class V-fold PLP-dependent enzyme [Anaerolineales bacterium]|nr:aminotransferase class V-fold PLP-dependent enzyme [Anaerolineales bacterium]